MVGTFRRVFALSSPFLLYVRIDAIAIKKAIIPIYIGNCAAIITKTCESMRT